MLSRSRRNIGAALLLSALFVARSAAGQPDAPEVKPPELVRFVQAEPPESLEREARVLLELTIDQQGRVSDARVLESVAPDVDRAALEAAKQFEFRPARRDDQPVAVTIRYAFVLAPRAVDREPLPAPVARPEPFAEPKAQPNTGENLEPELEYGATAEVEAPARGVTRRSIEAEQLSRTPGTRGDAIRAVDIMPGVHRSSANDGGPPLIRGANWTESQVFLDGAPVPVLFHFGGLTSFFQSRLLERVELHPGNFSVRYGRAVGGVVDAKPRALRLDRVHAMVDLSVLDSAAMVEAPLADRTAVALAARRSNIDFFFEQFVPEDAYSVVAAPVYWDYQAIGETALGAGNRLRLMAYGSRDSIELVFSEPNDADPTLRGEVGGSISFHRLNARLDSRLARDVQHAASVTFGVQDFEGRIGPLVQELSALELHARSDVEINASREIGLTFGVDFFGQLADGRYIGPRPSGFEGQPSDEQSSLLSERIEGDAQNVAIVHPALFFELALRPVDRVSIVPGVRLDYFENLGVLSADPRLAVRIEATSTTTVKSGVGIFSQPPLWYEVLEEVGNPDLKPYRAAHFGAGVEQQLGDDFAIDFEAFYKRVWDRVASTPGGRPPHLENAGSDRIMGAEVGARLSPTPRTFGYLAYTLSRSERRNRDEDFRLFDGDQTHVLSLVASQDLGAGWELGARFRYVTGNPTTPVVAAVYDARVDQYRPIYGRLNSERLPAFHQLDVRVEKKWTISDLSLAVYLELLNAYNRQNVEGTRYSYDYSRREQVSGLPILPNLGIRGEL